jgi:hypothetical protein
MGLLERRSKSSTGLSGTGGMPQEERVGNGGDYESFSREEFLRLAKGARKYPYSWLKPINLTPFQGGTTMNQAIGRFMKIFSISTAAVALISMNVPAQTKMSIGAGLDVMMPVGAFGNHWNTGFGGAAEFDYALSEHSAVTGKIGYLTWGGKDLPSGTSAATYSGVPILAGIKYYPRFIPQQSPVHVYGHLELGLMAGSVSFSGNTPAGWIAKGTGFTVSPSAGIEIPAPSKGKVDLSIRYFDISKRASVGLRAGYMFAIK